MCVCVRVCVCVCVVCVVCVCVCVSDSFTRFDAYFLRNMTNYSVRESKV